MKKIIVSLFIFSVLVFTAFSQTADEIVSKYIKNSGGSERWKSLKSLKMTGKIPTPQGDLSFIMYRKAPDKMLTEINIQGMRIVPQAYDGEVAWTINPMSGNDPQKLPDEMIKSMKDEAILEDPFVNYSQKGHQIEYLGKETVNGVEYNKVNLLKNKNNDEPDILETYYFDIEYNLPIIVKSKVEGNELETVLGNYSEVEGFMMPMSIDVKMPGQPQQSISIEKIEINPAISDDFFKFKK